MVTGQYPIEQYLNARAASAPQVSSDGRWLAFLTDITGTPQVWRLGLGDNTTGWPQQVTFGSDRVMAFCYSAAEGDGRLIYSRDVGGNERAQLFLLNEDGTKICLTEGFEEAMHGLCDWTEEGGRILFSANRRDASLFDLYVQDLDGTAARLVWENPQHGSIGEARFSPDGARAIVIRNRSSFDNDLIEVNLTDVVFWKEGDSVSARMTHSDHGGIPTATFVIPDLVSYPTFDDRRIPAFYYRPAGNADRSPAIVIVHGGPEGQSRPTFQGLIQYFVQNGFAVFVPNVRGSTGYGTTYADLDNVRKRMDAVADLAHGAEWLRRRPEIDPDRLVVYGGSYGGFMVLSALTTYPDLWAAGVDIVGISSFLTFLENTSGYRRAHRAAEYGSLEHDREFLREISPMTHVEKIRVPMVVIHGRNDPRVPLTEAEQLVAALRSRDIPVEFLVFEDEGHGLAKLKNRIVAYEAVVRFLEEHATRQT